MKFKSNQIRKILIDCDAGTDDAIALILLISAHKKKELEIKGITCVGGNTDIDNVIRNVFRTLAICNTLDIPVYKGAHSALVAAESAKIAQDIHYHGNDGFGDVFDDDPDISKLEAEHAVVALHRIITENPNEISLVCLGPLTNVALAVKVYPEVLDNVKDFYIMGGNSAAIGNATSQAEFNFYADPESVHIVLASNTKPLWLLPWETCAKSDITHDWRDNTLGTVSSKQAELINKIEAGAFATQEKLPFYTPCDAFLAALVISPDLITKATDHHADIELAGVRTRGQVVLDHLKINRTNTHLIEDIDFTSYQKLMLAVFSESL